MDGDMKKWMDGDGRMSADLQRRSARAPGGPAA